MKKDLPISPNKKFKYSISFESWDEESLEAGQSDVRGYEVDDNVEAIGDILYEANTTYGIYMPVSFGNWESTEPEEDRDFWEKGIRKYYTLHITNDDGTQISQEENDFITYLLSDGRYEIDKFREYAVGGVVLGSVALGVGALITYFYFKGKKGNKNNRAKSVTHIINGKERKYPIKDAWRKDHNLENKSQKFEVPQAERFEMGGDASEHYHEVEYGEGGIARAKEIITKKIGLNEENADFIASQSEKFAIWLADSIVKAQMNLLNSSKQQVVAYLNSNNSIKGYRERIRGILDWLESPNTPKQNLRELTFDKAEEKAKQWHDELNVSGGDVDYVEPKENVILKTYQPNEFGKTYYWVMLPSNKCNLESSRMGHCGQSSYSDNLISFRSNYKNVNGEEVNDSHITIGYGNGYFYQVKGKQNKKPLEKYHPYIFDLIKSILNGEINERFKKENDESIKVVEYLSNEQKRLEQEILPNITFGFAGASSTEYRFLQGELSLEESSRYLSQDCPALDLFRKIEVLKQKRDEARNNRVYEELENSITQLRDEAKSFIQKNIFDKYQEIIRLSNLQKEAENELLHLYFNGFSSEYKSSEDYGWEDMTKEELKELYEINPDIFSDFAGKYMLYEAGISSERPNTTIVIEKSPEYVADLLRLDSDLSDEVVEKVLTGETHDWFNGSDSWSYYFENAGDYVDNLNEENYEEVIDKIVEITGLDKSVVKENGAKHYLDGQDEEFDSDNFDDIKRAIGSALSNAEEDAYVKYYYEQIEDALSELGTIKKLNYDGVELEIDLSDLMSISAISSYMNDLETESLEDVFFEAESQGEFELPNLSIDDRYTPYPEDINSHFDIDNYEKGGSLRPKNAKIKNKIKIKNMKPSQRKLAQGGNIDSNGISKEDYYLVVNNWVYFTFNYPIGFVKDAFNSKHLEEKFSSSYERYGSVGVLMSFWANLDGNNREILSLWIKNNYFNSQSQKEELKAISNDNYAKIITHWNMFCFNFPYGFIENVYGENTSHFEMKWVRAYESAGSTGAVNKFYTEMSSNNQRLLTDWVYEK